MHYPIVCVSTQCYWILLLLQFCSRYYNMSILAFCSFLCPINAAMSWFVKVEKQHSLGCHWPWLPGRGGPAPPPAVPGPGASWHGSPPSSPHSHCCSEGGDTDPAVSRSWKQKEPNPTMMYCLLQQGSWSCSRSSSWEDQSSAAGPPVFKPQGKIYTTWNQNCICTGTGNLSLEPRNGKLRLPVCFCAEFLISWNLSFKEHWINEGCESDQCALINQVHLSVVFTWSLPIFLCFKSSSLFHVFLSWWFGSLKIGAWVKSSRHIGRGAFTQSIWVFLCSRRCITTITTCSLCEPTPSVSVITGMCVTCESIYMPILQFSEQR